MRSCYPTLVSCLQSTHHKCGVILTIAVFQAEGRICFVFRQLCQALPRHHTGSKSKNAARVGHPIIVMNQCLFPYLCKM